MVLLEDCPDEILVNILSRVHRGEQLANLSLACRRLRDLVSPFLQDCKSFRFLYLGHIERPRLPCVPFRSILHRPKLSSYVLQVQVELHDFGIEYYSVESDLLSQAEEGELFERAVRDFGICEWEDGEELIGALKEGNQSCRVALLLLMHPNLEVLSIELAGDDSWVQRVVWKFTSPFPVPPPRCCHGFHALREVDFSHCDTEGGFDLQCLSPFFLLPSIRKISGHMASNEEGEGFDWDKDYYISTVTELYFFYSSICLQAFAKLLRIPKALNHFHYDFGGAEVGYADFNYEKLFAVVKEAQCGLDDANIEILAEDGLQELEAVWYT